MSKQTKPLPDQPVSRWQRGFPGWLNRNKWTLIVLYLALLIFIAAFLTVRSGKAPVHQATGDAGLFYDPAVVEKIGLDTIAVDPYTLDKVELGNQEMQVRLTGGKFKGHTVIVTNYVSAFNSRKMEVGEKIVLCIYTESHDPGTVEFRSDGEQLGWAIIDGSDLPAYQTESGEISVFTNASVYAPNRLLPVIILVILFFIITTLVGGKTGVKSLLGLVITVVCLIWIMCPLLMKGAPMIPTAFIICVYVAIVSFVILDGITKKSLCAFLGTFAGMLLAAIFGEIAQGIAKINSYNMYDVNSLIEEFKNIQMQGIPLHITGVISAGIIIASLGAVMDVAMSLSSSISELKAVNPELTFRQLWKSGMNIGRDMVGTMTNTLILAFIGGDLVLMIWLWSLDLSLYQLLSSAFLSVELVSALSSSIGVILAVPLTALISAAMHAKTPPKA